MTDRTPEQASGARVAPAADYDTFVDWTKRLEREGPFFRGAFEAHRVRTVLDVGCGSGRHALMWAGWGLDVVGADIDPSMLAQAEINRREVARSIEAVGGTITFVDAGFGTLESAGLGGFDAVTCTGNALPHVAGPAGLKEALEDFAAVLRPGGLLILHLLNHDRLLTEHLRAIPPVVRETDEGTRVLQSARPVMERVEANMLAAISPKDRADLISLLGSLIDQGGQPLPGVSSTGRS